jgi:hypothetical protein
MLLNYIEKQLRDSGVSPARFGRAAVGDPSFVFELRRGRDPRPQTATKVMAYIEMHRVGFKQPIEK